ncbi:MAG TPA: 2-phospho-L-lactate transferase [Chloroflexota bacterium]
MITALCGGVGGSKLAVGLYRTLPPDELSIVVNTADDLEFYGLHISPDLDTVTYTLAGLARTDVGWGLEGDSFAVLSMLGTYGAPTWFQIGDRDLATDIYRTDGLRTGKTLTSVTREIASSLGVHASIFPMTDARVATRLLVHGEWLEFQDYFVRRRHADPVEAIRYDGIGEAPATSQVLEAIESAEVIVVVNSNPALSIMPILSTPGVNDTLVATSARRIAVSPIVGSDAVTGPAGRLMRLLGYEASATGVAEAYLGVIDGILIHTTDAAQKDAIEGLGVAVQCADTIMRTEADRERLAAEAISFARSL